MTHGKFSPLIFLFLFCSFATQAVESYQKVEKGKTFFKNVGINTEIHFGPIHGTNQERSTVDNSQNTFFHKRDLTLTTDGAMVHPHVDFLVFENYSFSFDTGFNISHSSKNAEHSEWDRLKKDTPNPDMHTSFLTTNKIKTYQSEFGYHFFFFSKRLSLAPGLAYSYKSFDYRLGKFIRSYPSTEISTHNNIQRQEASYLLQTKTPMITASTSLNLKKWITNFKISYSPFVKSKMEEKNVIRNESSHASFDGNLYGGRLVTKYLMTPNLHFSLDLSYEYLDLKGTGKIESNTSGQEASLDSKIISKHGEGLLGIHYLF